MHVHGRNMSVGMRSTIVILALVGMLAAPIACAIAVCPVMDTHDCCPTSKTASICPLDILLSAKAALPAIVPVALPSLTVQIESFAVDPPPFLTPDGRDLHL